MRPNPPLDPQALFNDFLNQIQEHKGQDVSEFSEEEWRRVLPEFGIEDPDQIVAALENLAGWGVVDNYVWSSPIEQDIDDEIKE